MECGKWQPTGMPAIVKLFEGLQKRGYVFEVVLIDKTDTHPRNSPRKIIFEEFSADFHILTSLRPLARFVHKPVLSKAARFINALFHFYRIGSIITQADIDVIYTDRENVVIGGLLALLGNKVILRLHGVHVFFDRFNNPLLRFRYPLRFLSFKAPFQHIIVSEDGTPAKEFLEKFTSPTVRKSVLLNGVDKSDRASNNVREKFNIPDGRPIILFVGRLDEGKGAEVFLQCVEKLVGTNANFCALIVGDGKLYDKLKSQTKGRQNFIFAGSIEHSEIHAFYSTADIYVSLNSLGNLSNTVLEALQAGNCIVTYKKDELSLRDRSTERHLRDAAVFIDRYKVVEELPSRLNDLLSSPERLQRLKMKAKKQANRILRTWEQRIEEEIHIIEEVRRVDFTIKLSAQKM